MENSLNSTSSSKKVNKVHYAFADGASSKRQVASDKVIVEQPLQIKLLWQQANVLETKVFAITMRTPGDDKLLIMGLLFSEGIIASKADIAVIEVEHEPNQTEPNLWCVQLAQGVVPKLASLEQYQMTYSSCGLCGTTSIKNLELKNPKLPLLDSEFISVNEIYSLANSMRANQQLFELTGGVHGAALFDQSGKLQWLNEDIGRHNAVDKVIGQLLVENEQRTNKLFILLVSGRISFEIVQKTLMAGVSVLVGVGAPSDLAIQAAKRFDLTLIGFANEHSFNVYHGDWRLLN